MDYLQNVGRLEGAIKAMSERDKSETIIQVLVTEAIKTSEIEGEYLSREDVASSIKKNLGILNDVDQVKDQRAKGVAELMIRVRNNYQDPLHKETLLDWHRVLMQHDKSINAGSWRSHKEPMQIVSGPMGRERVHFQAPPSQEVAGEMLQFLKWFNNTAPLQKGAIKHAPIRAAIAHIYFETIHPFKDGNGRIGRALSEKALAQTSGHPQLISLSAAIERNKKDYYRYLEQAQRSNEITEWLVFFLRIIVEAQNHSQRLIDFSLKKTLFFDQFRERFNAQQLKVIQRILAEGVEGFTGGMNAEKYMRIAKVSKATATRHLQELVSMGAMQVSGKGRATRYALNLE